jgi:uncharacterized Zn-binding protein involved in type VI secretion
MSGAVCRVGDKNEQGGVILNGENSVLVNGRPIAVFGSKVTPHPCCGTPNRPDCAVHCNATTTSTNGTVLAGGKPVVTVGDKDTCTHPRKNGSSDVVIG